MTPTLRCSHFSTTESSQSSLNFFSPMNQATCFIVLNTRGVDNDNFNMNFRDLINSHNPCFVALLETKLSNHLGLMYDFGFDDYWEVPAIGRSGGIVLLWHTSFVSITRKRQTSHELHAMIKVLPDSPSWYFSTIYASTDYNIRKLLWDNLSTYANSISGPWLVAADFNEVQLIMINGGQIY
ncbi:hypothetical protein P3S67_015964 [Capsicum chacoense]